MGGIDLPFLWIILYMFDTSTIQNQAIEAVNSAKDITALDAVRVEYLGKKGILTEVLKGLSQLPASEKPIVGQQVNRVKKILSEAIEVRQDELKHLELEAKLASEHIDVTLNGRQPAAGSLHPVTQVKQRINEFFSQMGFDIVTGPEVEDEYYNFEALNIPDDHPARAMHDTFYFGDGRLLRTHTSPVQIRTMEQQKPPFRLIAPGRVYRCDSDVTHTPMFHQVEGLVIDKDVTLGHMKHMFEQFFTWFFDKPLSVRFRPSYFPFTEPSAELDLSCTQCAGSGCRSCKYTGWLEVLGCGMVHPKVLKAVNVDADEYQGFAFGLGIDRLAMLYFGIDDLRLMFENDVDFLKQF